MKPFAYVANPMRVTFGAGSLAALSDELAALGLNRALILSTPNQKELAEHAALLIGDRTSGLFSGAVMHVPTAVADEARSLTRSVGADCTIAIGGGSTIGLAKAIALDDGIPIVAVPTTYAGSEMTPIFGLTGDGVKRTGKDMRVLPRSVIYDPDLTLDLPVGISVTSAINAIAHSVEGLYANDANPVISLMAEEAIRALSGSIPAIRRDARDRDARALALYGAWLSGTVLGNVGMALHHKLCHTLGGSFGLPHAEVHTVVLPHALAYNAPFVPDAVARTARALGRADPAKALFELAHDNAAPTSLRELGLAESDLDRATDLALANPYWNPRPLERDALRQLLQNAWDGRSPSG